MGTTVAQKKLFFNLRKLKGRLQALEDGDMAPETVTRIAHQLKVQEEDVVNMNRRLAAQDHSLNAPLREEGEDQYQDRLVDETESQETTLIQANELAHRRRLLASAMTRLSERERDILVERRLQDTPATFEDLSQRFGISRERVHQIEFRAFGKIKKSVKNTIIEQRLAS